MLGVTQVCSLAMCCRAPSIPEAQDLSRSSSNASSFASVVEEHEGEDEYDTGQVGGDGKVNTVRLLLQTDEQLLTQTFYLPSLKRLKQRM